MRVPAFLAGAALVTAALLAWAAQQPEEPAWSEVAWPFPLDPWAGGRSFRCRSGACGDLSVHLRPKIGFCNCATGVADDDEIDRVSDVVLLGPRYGPEGEGWPVALGALSGRARRYVVPQTGSSRRHAVALALSRGCDVVVALVDSAAPLSPRAEAAAFALLRSPAIIRWTDRSIGRGGDGPSSSP